MSCAQCQGIERMFDRRAAERELRQYRAAGPGGTTRLLIDALKAEGVAGLTLLDIGGGVGAIQHELLRAGARSATAVDASSAYLDAARAEVARLGHADRGVYHPGVSTDSSIRGMRGGSGRPCPRRTLFSASSATRSASSSMPPPRWTPSCGATASARGAPGGRPSGRSWSTG